MHHTQFCTPFATVWIVPFLPYIVVRHLELRKHCRHSMQEGLALLQVTLAPTAAEAGLAWGHASCSALPTFGSNAPTFAPTTHVSHA
jgi:hypothetical protein